MASDGRPDSDDQAHFTEREEGGERNCELPSFSDPMQVRWGASQVTNSWIFELTVTPLHMNKFRSKSTFVSPICL